MKNKVFFIAEAGINHNGDLKKAITLIDIAIKAGADAVKFQFFKTNELCTVKSKTADYQIKKNIKKKSQFDLLKKFEMSEIDLLKIKKYCKNKINLMITPFDFASLKFLKKKKYPLIKISSGDNDNYLFIEAIAKSRAKIFLSAGMISDKNLKKTLSIFRKYDKKPFILHCVSIYPTSIEQSNLERIQHLKIRYPNYIVGYSDHTQNIETPAFAVIKGAKVIEKHFTFSKKSKGPDHKFSLSFGELKKCISLVRLAEKFELNACLNSIHNKEQKIAQVSKKRILAKKKIKKGERISQEKIKLIRNKNGKYAYEIYKILNSVSKKKYNINDPI